MARDIHVGFTISENEKETLEKIAKKEDRTKAAILRRALLEYVETHK